MRFSFANMSWLSQGAAQAHTAAGREREADGLADAALSRTPAPRQARPVRDPAANRLDLRFRNGNAPTARADAGGSVRPANSSQSARQHRCQGRSHREADCMPALSPTSATSSSSRTASSRSHTSSGRRLLAHEHAHVTQQPRPGQADIARDEKPGPTLDDQAIPTPGRSELPPVTLPRAKPLVAKAARFLRARCGRSGSC